MVSISPSERRRMCDRADDAATTDPRLSAPNAVWMAYYASDVNALLAWEKTLRGLLESWIEAACVASPPFARCALCGLHDEHRADCPVPYTQMVLRP
jgi:hypothetical protein